jgi:hypothetical protein
MIPYNELCQALEAVKSRRQAEAELRELEQIDENNEDDVGANVADAEPIADYAHDDATAVAVASFEPEVTEPGFAEHSAPDAGLPVEADFAVDGVPTVPGPEGDDAPPLAVDTIPHGPNDEGSVEVGEADVIGEVEVAEADVIGEKPTDGTDQH